MTSSTPTLSHQQRGGSCIGIKKYDAGAKAE